MTEEQETAALLPRDESAKLDGSKLKIVRDLSRGPRRVAITDGERIAIYSPIPPPEYERSLGFAEALEAVSCRSRWCPAMPDDDILLENYRNAWQALRMVRETIETLGPPGAPPSEEARRAEAVQFFR